MKDLEKYRVKPKLSLTSRDIYKRFLANSLEISMVSADQFSVEGHLSDARRLTKPQLLASIDVDRKTVESIKNKLSKSQQQ